MRWKLARANPYRVGKSGKLATADAGRTKGAEFVVGMVGRNADQKDWPSFHKIEEIIQKRLSDSLGPAILDGRKVKFLNAGEGGFCDGVSAIRQMDVFVMTSRHEELPTVVLECFALGTPICGFVPLGGVIDILGFSDGSVRKAFIRERDCECLADIVIGLLSDENKRMQMICDGRRILYEHFAAEKLVPEQLTAIYQKVQRG